MTLLHKIFLFSCFSLLVGGTNAEDATLPTFQATTLSGDSVDSAILIGQPTLLLITPSREAAAATRKWGNNLRKNLKLGKLMVRNIICLELPFFLSTSDVIGKAREKVPAQYHDQTWLVDGTKLENALNVPTGSDQAFVFLLDTNGEIAEHAGGEYSDEKIQKIETAVDKLFQPSRRAES